MTQTALARKWRPHRFEDLAGQTAVVRTLRNALNQQRLHHAYLFTGTRGVGKTTLARIMAKCFNCETGVTATPCDQCSACQSIDQGRFPDLMEVDAASRTKVEDTRDLLDNVQYAPSQGRYKVYIIDEVHMLSGHSFNALLKTLEEPPSHVKFLLATTEPEKLPKTVRSRCLQFHLQALDPQTLEGHLANILNKENIPFEPAALHLLALAAEGSVRDSLSLLDQAIAYGAGAVQEEPVAQMLGYQNQQSLFELLDYLADSNADALFQAIQQLSKTGADFLSTCKQLLGHLHQIALLQQLPQLHLEPSIKGKLEELSRRFAPTQIQLIYQILLQGQRDLLLASSPQMGFEMLMLRCICFQPVDNQPVLSQAPSPKKTEIPITQPTSMPIETEWAEVILKLNLTGASQMLAKYCTMQRVGERMYLSVAPQQQALANDRNKQRIEEPLRQIFGQSLEIHWQAAQSDQQTPYRKEEEQRVFRQQQATDSIAQDSQVQRIMKTFNAQLIDDSIQPIES